MRLYIAYSLCGSEVMDSDLIKLGEALSLCQNTLFLYLALTFYD